LALDFLMDNLSGGRLKFLTVIDEFSLMPEHQG